MVSDVLSEISEMAAEAEANATAAEDCGAGFAADFWEGWLAALRTLEARLPQPALAAA